MSKGLSYLFKKTLGHIHSILYSAGFSVKDTLTLLKKRNPNFNEFPKEIVEERQEKHIVGNKNYAPGKSILSISLADAQQLIYKYSGKGQQLNDNKERVDFNKEIGVFIDLKDDSHLTTTIGIIHYSKKGTHIVPARPRKRG